LSLESDKALTKSKRENEKAKRYTWASRRERGSKPNPGGIKIAIWVVRMKGRGNTNV